MYFKFEECEIKVKIMFVGVRVTGFENHSEISQKLWSYKGFRFSFYISKVNDIVGFCLKAVCKCLKEVERATFVL